MVESPGFAPKGYSSSSRRRSQGRLASGVGPAARRIRCPSLDSRMNLEPTFRPVGGPIRKHACGTPLLKVDQNRSPAPFRHALSFRHAPAQNVGQILLRNVISMGHSKKVKGLLLIRGRLKSRDPASGPPRSRRDPASRQAGSFVSRIPGSNFGDGLANVRRLPLSFLAGGRSRGATSTVI